MTSPRPAVLFDVDGTLLDTNYFHAIAWWRALQDAGEDIAMARIHPLIGMGSDQLLQDLLGEEREGLSDVHANYYKPYKEELLHPFPRAADLLAAVAERGAQVVLATSSKEQDLDKLLEALGADDDVIADIVHGDLVGSSKPAPDIFAVALDHLDLDPEQTIVVGDTKWDIEAAAKLGIDVVAVLTGGTTRADLQDAGAVAVYEDVAELLDRLDDSPLARLLQ
ncbi:MAG TPA: HAD family hydrolase [Acidimicrobiales bacterium]|nr:HAD family hydrolase [Acidimicrobiales bacterium]